MNVIIYWLLVAIIMLSTSVKAQLPGMRLYTQQDGYPGTTGYHLSQDARGFIWIATNNGAACFDGEKFRVIDDKDGLTDKEIIYALPYWEENVLLLPLLNNLALYKNGKVITAAQNKNLGFIANKTINICRYDEVTKKAWLGDAHNNSFLYCIAGDSMRKVAIKAPTKFEHVGVINNSLYLVGYPYMSNSWPSYFATYDIQNEAFTPFKFVYQAGKEVDIKKYSQFKVSNDGKYVAAVHEKVNVEIFEIKGDELHHKRSIRLSQHWRFLNIDRNNHLWVALSTSGVEYWGSLAGNEILNEPIYFLDNIVINDILVDREGHLWFTTEQKGLYFISSKHWENALRVLQLKLPPYPPKYITGNGKNSIYIGHSAKACFTYIKNGSSTTFNIPEGSPLGIRTIFKMDEHILMSSNALAIFTEKQSRIAFKSLWRHGSIKDIDLYSDEHLILAENFGVVVVKVDNLDEEAEGGAVTIFDGRATSIQILPDSSLLVGTPNGLFLKPGLYKQAVLASNGKLKNAYITDLLNARGNFVLVGTNAQGLYVYNFLTAGASQVPFPPNNNPASIRHIFRQNDSVYWVSTDIGVSRIFFDQEMEAKNITTYSFFDGLPSNDVTSAYVQNDTAYIATIAGLGILPLKNPIAETQIPKLWLTSIKIEDSLVYFPKGMIDLNHNQGNIQLSVSALYYENIGEIKYMYRLLGLSEKWTESESPEISFSGLAPGKYVLEAYVVNYKGIKSKTPLLVSIVVHPAFWQTTWFSALLYILIGSLVLFIVYRVIINKKNAQYNKMQQKKRLAELELEAIKAQINPHFVYNCLNSIQYFSYKNEFERVKQYLDVFAKLIRQTMQYSQETFITLEEEIDYLTNYLKLEKVRFKDKLNYRIEMESGIDPSLMIPSMLVQPYVENAMKHGVAKLDTPGEVWISFTRAPGNCIKVIIEDNGPGLQGTATDAGRKPLGMRISGSRAETYNQLFELDIRISLGQRKSPDGHLKGTRVELLIPPIKYGDTKL